MSNVKYIAFARNGHYFYILLIIKRTIFATRQIKPSHSTTVLLKPCFLTQVCISNKVNEPEEGRTILIAVMKSKVKCILYYISKQHWICFQTVFQRKQKSFFLIKKAHKWNTCQLSTLAVRHVILQLFTITNDNLDSHSLCNYNGIVQRFKYDSLMFGNFYWLTHFWLWLSELTFDEMERQA